MQDCMPAEKKSPYPGVANAQPTHCKLRTHSISRPGSSLSSLSSLPSSSSSSSLFCHNEARNRPSQPPCGPEDPIHVPPMQLLRHLFHKRRPGSGNSVCSLQRDPEGPSQPYASPRAHCTSRPCNSKRHQPSQVSPTTCNAPAEIAWRQSVSQSVRIRYKETPRGPANPGRQSGFVTKRPRGAQPTLCKPRDPIHVPPM